MSAKIIPFPVRHRSQVAAAWPAGAIGKQLAVCAQHIERARGVSLEQARQIALEAYQGLHLARRGQEV